MLQAPPPYSAGAFEELDIALVLERGGLRGERAEIAPLAGLGIDLARVEPVTAVLELPDHGFAFPSSESIIAFKKRAASSPVATRWSKVSDSGSVRRTAGAPLCATIRGRMVPAPTMATCGGTTTRLAREPTPKTP